MSERSVRAAVRPDVRAHPSPVPSGGRDAPIVTDVTGVVNVPPYGAGLGDSGPIRCDPAMIGAHCRSWM
jgi:hypothetical protein